MKGRRPVFAFSPPCSVWASGGIATADWMLVTVSILPWENVAPLLAWLPNRAAAYARGPDPDAQDAGAPLTTMTAQRVPE